MVKLQTYKGKYFLTIPKDKAIRSGIKSGDEFDCDLTHDNNLIFVKLKK